MISAIVKHYQASISTVNVKCQRQTSTLNASISSVNCKYQISTLKVNVKIQGQTSTPPAFTINAKIRSSTLNVNIGHQRQTSTLNVKVKCQYRTSLTSNVKIENQYHLSILNVKVKCRWQNVEIRIKDVSFKRRLRMSTLSLANFDHQCQTLISGVNSYRQLYMSILSVNIEHETSASVVNVKRQHLPLMSNCDLTSMLSVNISYQRHTPATNVDSECQSETSTIIVYFKR